MPQGMSGTFDNASNKWGILKYSRDKKKKNLYKNEIGIRKKIINKIDAGKKIGNSLKSLRENNFDN